jgi:hypothetical protein
MANKVTILEGTRQPYGGVSHRLLYWFAINPAITDGATPATLIIPQSWSALPNDAKRYIADGSADAIALNNGAAGFDIVERLQGPTETISAFATRILADHASYEAWWIGQQRARYQRSGQGTS